MDKITIKEFLKEKKENRPIMSIRQVGERIEIWALGAMEPLVYVLPKEIPVYSSAELSRKLAPELKAIAEEMGLPVKGRKKATLIANILYAQAR